MNTLTDSKTICTLTGQQYRAAFACRASKDVRYYLDSIFISAEHNEIVSTNGHIMYKAPIEAPIHSDTDLIIDAAKIPANIDHVLILEHGEHSVLVETITKAGKSGPQFVCKLIEAKYPDYKVVWPSKTEPATPYTQFVFGSLYLALIQRVFGKKPVRFNLNDPKRPAVIDIDDESHGSLLLMPCARL